MFSQAADVSVRGSQGSSLCYCYCVASPCSMSIMAQWPTTNRTRLRSFSTPGLCASEVPLLIPFCLSFAGHPHCDCREQGRSGHLPPGGQAGGGQRLGVLRAAPLKVSQRDHPLNICLTKYGPRLHRRRMCNSWWCTREQLGEDNCQKLCNTQAPDTQRKAARPPNSCNFHK